MDYVYGFAGCYTYFDLWLTYLVYFLLFAEFIVWCLCCCFVYLLIRLGVALLVDLFVLLAI